MKKYLIVFLFSFCFAQQKGDGRFQIVDLGTDSNAVLVVLIDSQTGQCWQLSKDSIPTQNINFPIYSNSGNPSYLTTWVQRYIWTPVYFEKENSSFYTQEPTTVKSKK